MLFPPAGSWYRSTFWLRPGVSCPIKMLRGKPDGFTLRYRDRYLTMGTCYITVSLFIRTVACLLFGDQICRSRLYRKSTVVDLPTPRCGVTVVTRSPISLVGGGENSISMVRRVRRAFMIFPTAHINRIGLDIPAHVFILIYSRIDKPRASYFWNPPQPHSAVSHHHWSLRLILFID